MGCFDWGWNFHDKRLSLAIPKMPEVRSLQNSCVRTEANTFSPPAFSAPLPTRCGRYHLLGRGPATLGHHISGWNTNPNPSRGGCFPPKKIMTSEGHYLMSQGLLMSSSRALPVKEHSLCCGISNMLIGNTSSRYEVWWLYLQMETFHLSLL